MGIIYINHENNVPNHHVHHIYIIYIYIYIHKYSQVHGSPVLKALSFNNLNWISATTITVWARSKS